MGDVILFYLLSKTLTWSYVLPNIDSHRALGKSVPVVCFSFPVYAKSYCCGLILLL